MITIGCNDKPQSRLEARGGMLRVRNYISLLCLLFVYVCSACGIGCAANKELAQVRLEADECRLELQALRKQLDQYEDESLVRAKHDRLAAENEYLKRELAQVRERELQLRKNLGIDEKETTKAGDQLKTQREELQRTLANLRRSRSQWESTLAERQRQIDVLTNQVERLEKELQTAREAAGLSTQPG